jgi:DNA-binding transcriptional MerR regulator
MDATDYDIDALARAAGVNPRTVRYYVRERLIPSPGTRGPGARYGRSAVDRLRLVKLLQSDGWPLAKIREKLEQLDEDGVRAALGDPPELPLPLSDTALSYVRKVMKKGTRRERVGEADLFAAPAAALVPVDPPSGWEIRKSTWERIRLSPNVELSVRRPLAPEESKKVDRLIEAARKLFEP